MYFVQNFNLIITLKIYILFKMSSKLPLSLMWILFLGSVIAFSGSCLKAQTPPEESLAVQKAELDRVLCFD